MWQTGSIILKPLRVVGLTRPPLSCEEAWASGILAKVAYGLGWDRQVLGIMSILRSQKVLHYPAAQSCALSGLYVFSDTFCLPAT